MRSRPNDGLFDSSVISYDNQTLELRQEFRRKFESGVISYGNQTYNLMHKIFYQV